MICQKPERHKTAFIFQKLTAKLSRMASANLKKREERLYTVEEYLKTERESAERHEYIDGEIFLMAGESDAHGIISVNLAGEIYSQLKGKNCQSRVKDAKVKTGGFAQKRGQSMKGMFSYPDLVVVCGEVKYHDKKKDVILNPKVIIEVLSDSTGEYDRGDKFTRYRMFNETLTDYVLVSQSVPQIDHFIRQDDGSWKVFTYIGSSEVFKIESIECELKLSEIYDRIEFSKETLKFLEDIANIK